MSGRFNVRDSIKPYALIHTYSTQLTIVWLFPGECESEYTLVTLLAPALPRHGQRCNGTQHDWVEAALKQIASQDATAITDCGTLLRLPDDSVFTVSCHSRYVSCNQSPW